jgi:hypothetical protein
MTQIFVVDQGSGNTVDTSRLIDVGPFFDRFKASKIAVLASTNGTVRALVQDVMSRKWIDLSRPDVAQAVDILIALNVDPGIAPLRTAILNDPVTPAEQWALMKTYFS